MDRNEELPSTSSDSISVLTKAQNDDAEDSDNEKADKNDTAGEDEGSPPNQPVTSREKALLEENKGLNATVHELKISLAIAQLKLDHYANHFNEFETRVDAAVAELLKKGKKEQRKQIFSEIRKRKAMKKELVLLLKQEEELKGTETALSNDLQRTTFRNASKEVEVQELKRRLNRLRRSEEMQTAARDHQIGSTLEGAGGGTEEALWIFPEEIWMIIFGKLQVWQDVWNCSKSCMLFHRKLHPLKTTFLFDQVFPYLFEHLPGHDILKCRSICKKWNSVVDCYLENHPSIRPQSENNNKSLHCPSFLNPMTEKRLGEVYIFSPRDPGYLRKPGCLDGAMLTSRNPFVGRSFCIELLVGYDWGTEGQDGPAEGEEQGRMKDEEYWYGLYIFLENYGKHIYYLTLKFSGDLSNPSDFTAQQTNSLLTFDLFRLLPNLRSICFDRGLHEFPMNEIGFLPSAPKLDAIGFHELLLFQDASSHPLRFALLDKFRPQLQKLYVQSDSWGREMPPLEWPKLTELHVRGIYRMTDLGNLLGSKMPQLRKLVLRDLEWKCRQWNTPFEHNEATLDRVLDTVAKLSATTRLDTLQIYGGIQEEHNSLGALQTEVLKLPMPVTIKTLELQFSPDTCHSFLLRFPHLENLKLFWRGQEKCTWNWCQPVQELVEVNKYVMGGLAGRRGIYKSNIWMVMPRLKLFSYQREGYTRDEFEQYINGQHEQRES